MKKIYIAGRISGECETPELMKECFKKFQSYGRSILGKRTMLGNYGLADGFVYNEELGHGVYYSNFEQDIYFTHGLLINSSLIKSRKGTYEQYMKNDISILLKCDEVHFLPDWKDSKGAIFERKVAEICGIKIVDVLPSTTT